MIVAFIDANRDEFGVEPICTVLGRCRWPRARTTRPRPGRCRPGRRDAVMIRSSALWKANYRVYGAHKLWKAARRAGHDIGRDQVARLMRAAGIEGVRRGNGYAPPDPTRRAAASRSGEAGLHRRPHPTSCG